MGAGVSGAWGAAWASAWGESWGELEQDSPEVPAEPATGGTYLLARQAPRRRSPREEEESLLLHLI